MRGLWGTIGLVVVGLLAFGTVSQVPAQARRVVSIAVPTTPPNVVHLPP